MKEGFEASAQKQLLDEKRGSLAKYVALFIGRPGLWPLFLYETVVTLFTSLPGGLGLVLRKLFFPRLFKRTGKRVVFGRNMTIRHPWKIEIGDNVVFDDNTVLDAKGSGTGGIWIGNNVFIGRNTSLVCKEGEIRIGDYSNIGTDCALLSETKIEIGRYVFLAGRCYLVAGGNHGFKDRETPIMFQPSLSKGGITVEEDVWLGASVTVLDGVVLGKGSVVGAASLVNRPIPPYSIAYGVPARRVQER